MDSGTSFWVETWETAMGRTALSHPHSLGGDRVPSGTLQCHPKSHSAGWGPVSVTLSSQGDLPHLAAGR